MTISDYLIISMTVLSFLSIDVTDTGSPLQGGVWYIQLKNGIMEQIKISSSSSTNVGQWAYLSIGI